MSDLNLSKVEVSLTISELDLFTYLLSRYKDNTIHPELCTLRDVTVDSVGNIVIRMSAIQVEDTSEVEAIAYPVVEHLADDGKNISENFDTSSVSPKAGCPKADAMVEKIEQIRVAKKSKKDSKI
jgi:hypothetical protein